MLRFLIKNHLWQILLVMAWIGFYCNGDSEDPSEDTGPVTDAGADVVADAGGDSGTDTGTDAAADAGIDGGTDCPSIRTVLPTDTVEENSEIPEGCYQVSNDLFISNNAVLTIKPGVTLIFGADIGIDINSDGSLTASGTRAKPILMTGQVQERGFWSGVYFLNSEAQTNVLDYVTIEYAGSREMNDDGAKPFRDSLFADSSGYDVRLSVKNSTIRKGLGFGFYLDHTSIIPEFTGNIITENTAGAGYVYAAAVHNLSDSSQYSGNDKDLVAVNTNYDFGEVDRTWAALDVPYQLEGIFILYQHLTIDAGASLYFTADSGIVLENDFAGISAIGTADKPILFSGVTKTPGFWRGLYFLNTNDDDPANPRSRLEYTTIEYGGGYSFLDGNAVPVRCNLCLDSSGWGSAVIMKNSTIRHSSGWGVWLDCLGNLIEDGMTYAGNAWGDHGQEQNCN